MSQFIETKQACGFQKLVSENGGGLQMGVSFREKMRVFCNSDVGGTLYVRHSPHLRGRILDTAVEGEKNLFWLMV